MAIKLATDAMIDFGLAFGVRYEGFGNKDMNQSPCCFAVKAKVDVQIIARKRGLENFRFLAG